tara:strand:+ start:26 stop:427 length:402 start_codon:yes stop_codon:yes gene_type:complete
MTDIPRYIFLTANKKITNPIYSSNRCDIFSYHGDVSNIDFEYQTKNYQNINQTLEPFNTKLKEIWYGKFTNSVGQIRSQFLVKSENGRVFWHKYEAMAPGGCQNKIYINGNQYKLTDWLDRYSHTDREIIMNQ